MIRSVAYALTASLLVIGVYYFYPYEHLPPTTIVDKIEVFKSKHQLLVYSRESLVRSYSISIGKKPGRKRIRGDMKTPEGEYFINEKNPNSNFHKSLLLSYPDSNDIKLAARFMKLAGGEIEIHGLNNQYKFIGRFQRWKDWTNGCIALTNEEVDDIYQHTPVHTRIIIYP